MAIAPGPVFVVLAAGRARRYGGIKPLAPVGPNGEAVIDLGASDALEAGFSSIVLVVNSDTGPIIEQHVKDHWPTSVDVTFAVQETPLGTVDAVNAARQVINEPLPFGVANADDLYGVDALKTAVSTIRNYNSTMLVGFHLDQALIGNGAVTRGVCEINDGTLQSVTERRQVARSGDHFVAADGLQPEILRSDTIVSMNLWGFTPQMWDLAAWKMARVDDASERNEVLLPELVAALIRGEFRNEFPALSEVLVATTTAQCVGVTHPDDLHLVQEAIRSQIERGERSPVPFSSPD